MDKIQYEKLVRGKGSDILLYKEGETKPFTGLATSWYKTGQVRFEVRYRNGILDGKATWWRRNGQKEYETTYTNGKAESFSLDSGQKKTS